MKVPAILITHSRQKHFQQVKKLLAPLGYHLVNVYETPQSKINYHEFKPDLVISITNGKGIDAARRIREQDKHIPIVLVSYRHSTDHLLAALKAQVNDYFIVPFSEKEFVASVQENLDGIIQPEPEIFEDGSPIIGTSRPMQEIKTYLKKIADTDSTVLITGETGTGKELAAEFIHQSSARKHHPFVSINSTALPETLVESELFGYEKGAFTGAREATPGKFEMSDKGTVFLDEIGDMSPAAQAKILRVIERKKVYRIGGKSALPLDFRLITASNRDLEELVADGNFRKDLYFRLNVAVVHMPALRKRKTDIPLLLDHFVREMNRRFGYCVRRFSKQAETYLFNYDWPGNVRELRNLIESSFINLSNAEATVVDLPDPLKKKLHQAKKEPSADRRILVSALLDTKWNKSRAAQKLNCSRMTIYRKMERYNIVEKRQPAR